tara:strand:- start:20833 stop:21504 length:672 start_codon:yes stop_codon:yes gene_type:complete
MSKVVLVVAAHSDDEVIGCGGTIARHVAEGDSVYAVFMADGVSSRVDADSSAYQKRFNATEKAKEILGIKEITFLGMPDNKMDTIAFLEIVQPLENVISKYKPSIIYTHHNGDLNVDHRLTHQAVMTACRPVPGSTIEKIFSFEVLSSTEWNSVGVASFVPNWNVDISAYLVKKKAALEAYSDEMRPLPHSRSIDNIMGLARYRGNTIGRDAAEAFMLVRSVC